MPANWSLLINTLLLIGVVITIGRLVRSRRKNSSLTPYEPPSLGINLDDIEGCDDIIAVRKINPELAPVPEIPASEPRVQKRGAGNFAKENSHNQPSMDLPPGKHIMMILLAKDNRQLVGYELLQTLLAAGLRFGEGSLFHRHQHANGQGPVLFSLAAATPTGVFDLQNMNAFNAKGLCLFMLASGNPTIDEERFTVMYETAKQLRDSLDAHLLDEQRQPLGPTSIARYHRVLCIWEPQEA